MKIKKTIVDKGFTLIELLLSMAILMILITILTSVFGQILDTQLESKSTSSVDQNGRYILSRLIYDSQQASTIITPSSAGQQTNTLILRINSIDYTYSVSNSGNFVLSNNNGTDVLNSNSASISGMTFTRLGNGGSTDNVRVSFTVTTRTQRPSGREQKNFQTTLGTQ